jgi:MYXO-CTERM domain-containing protein
VIKPFFPRIVLSLTAATVGLLAATPARAAIGVACVGDSITQNSGWSDKLGVRLGAGYTSTNYGVTTTTLLKKGDTPYWNTGAFTQSHQSNPAIVVIMLGTNDSKARNWDTYKGEFVADYEALIDTYSVLPSHPQIFLNLCPPAGTNGFGISGTVIENEIVPLIRQVAAARGVGVIDVFSAFGGHNLDPTLYGSAGDQVHPNGAGAQKIADTVYAALKAAPDGGATDAANNTGGGGASGTDAGKEASAADSAADAGAPDAGPSPDASGIAGSGGGGPGGAGGAGGSPAGSGGGGGAGGGGSTSPDGGGAAGTGGTTPLPQGTGSGGCGCRLSGSGGDGSAATVLLLLGLALVRRRRLSR